MLEEFLNIKAMASYLDLKRSTLYTLVEEKKIPHYRIGRQIRFKLSEIEDWLKERKEPVVDGKGQMKKVIRSLEKTNLNVDEILKKVVEEAKGKRYTSPQEKPGRIKGLKKEVDHGAV